MAPNLNRRLLVALLWIATAAAWAGDTLEAALQEVAGLEQAALAVEPGDGHAVRRLQTRAKSLLARLDYVEKFDRGTVQAARQRVLLIGRVLPALDTPGNLPLEIVEPPKRDNVPKASGPASAADEKTERRLNEIRTRYFSPMRALDAGDRLGFTAEHAKLLQQETVRFTEAFRQLAEHWLADKRTVRSLATTKWTEGRRHQLDEDLLFSIPSMMNTQLWRSRWYLEAACHGALRHAKESLGLIPITITIGGGNEAITWESGATTAAMLQFAYRAAQAGIFFEQRIGGDAKHWLEKQEEIEGIARGRGIKLEK